MWVFTKHGFYSAVVGISSTGSVTKDVIVVRSRERSHLENLRQHLRWTVKIHDTPESDYPCRLVVPKDVWVKAVEMLAAEVDYTNFKDAAEDNRMNTSPSYVAALHDIWLTMFTRSQPKERRAPAAVHIFDESTSGDCNVKTLCGLQTIAVESVVRDEPLPSGRARATCPACLLRSIRLLGAPR